MYQLVETIKCKNGELFNLRYHQARFNLTRRALFHRKDEINLENVIQIPDEFRKGLFRCRVIFGEKIEKVEFHPHQYRSVKSLKLIEANDLDYRFKYTNREKLNTLFEQRESCDDILIVKNGFITDSYISNVVFFDGRKWWTPDTPLLPGTQRARLIHEKKISVCPISSVDLAKYQKAGLINAMQDLDNMPKISISDIVNF
ncbi:aminotransferase class IV family protein [Mariniphaga sp.]|uniref:aminotransferase class IV family protein n=1 Tax=Mariniphaga sp. TaxID=1954475 RepID=UPI0035644E15